MLHHRSKILLLGPEKACGLEDSCSGAAVYVDRLTSCCPSVRSADLINFWAVTTNDLVGSESLMMVVLPKEGLSRGHFVGVTM